MRLHPRPCWGSSPSRPLSDVKGAAERGRGKVRGEEQKWKGQARGREGREEEGREFGTGPPIG